MIKPPGVPFRKTLLAIVFLSLWGAVLFPGDSHSRNFLTLTAFPVVKAESERVTLLELFEKETISSPWRELMSKEVIGKISQEGGVKYVYADQLRDFLAGFFGFHGMPQDRLVLNLPAQIVVKRPSTFVTEEEIVELYTEHLLQTLGKEREDLIIKDLQCSGGLALPPGTRESRVVARHGETYHGPVTLSVEFFVNGNHAGSAVVSATVSWLDTVVHTARPLRRNAVIEPRDLDVRRIVVSERNQGIYFTDPDEAVGKEASRNLDSFQPLQRSDVREAVVLRRGDSVTIVYEKPGLRVTARGQARQNGVRGQVIRVVNPQSSRSVDGRVVDSETVEAVH